MSISYHHQHSPWRPGAVFRASDGDMWVINIMSMRAGRGPVRVYPSQQACAAIDQVLQNLMRCV